eukprot:8106153-Pyramimonas_sp.AAC.1
METQDRDGTTPPGDTAQRDRDSEPYTGRPLSHSAPSAQLGDADGATAADETSHSTAPPATSPRSGGFSPAAALAGSGRLQTSGGRTTPRALVCRASATDSNSSA